jgi:hypothetical protein
MPQNLQTFAKVCTVYNSALTPNARLVATSAVVVVAWGPPASCTTPSYRYLRISNSHHHHHHTAVWRVGDDMPHAFPPRTL